MTETIGTIFGERTDWLRELRRRDAGFDEICAHFEIVLAEMNTKFGNLDEPTSDLIASFEELRRDIERTLRTTSSREGIRQRGQ